MKTHSRLFTSPDGRVFTDRDGKRFKHGDIVAVNVGWSDAGSVATVLGVSHYGDMVWVRWLLITSEVHLDNRVRSDAVHKADPVEALAALR